MIIGCKDVYKMSGIFIVSFCAVFVCALFLNYYMDLMGVETMVNTEVSRTFFVAQCNTSKVVSAVSGGCLLLTTVVLLCFYISHYIDTHKKQLGILKALGYSRVTIAKYFTIFGLPVLTGTASGYFIAHLFMPALYKVQNKEGYLPHFGVTFHLSLCMALVGLPAVFFALLAVFYSCYKLKLSALSLMRETAVSKVVKPKKESDMPFLSELKKSNVRQRKSLVFFITFAVFCFSSMMQMSCSMDELASRMMSVMIMVIGIVLATVTLFIATTAVIKANGKTILMMRVFGYGARDCANAVFGAYRIWAYLGFGLGTVYQYALLKIMVKVVFADMQGVPDYQFDLPVMLIAFAAFVLLYETIIFVYTKKMERVSIKEIMLE